MFGNIDENGFENGFKMKLVGKCFGFIFGIEVEMLEI